MNYNKIIFSLKIEDIQLVALEEIGRELTEDEIKKISNYIRDYLNWHDDVAHFISDNIKSDTAS